MHVVKLGGNVTRVEGVLGSHITRGREGEEGVQAPFVNVLVAWSATI